MKYLHRWPQGARLQPGLNVRWVHGPVIAIWTENHKVRFRLRCWRKWPIISVWLEYVRRDHQLEAWMHLHEMHAIVSVNESGHRSWRCYTCREQLINMGVRQWRKAGWTAPAIAAEPLVAGDLVALDKDGRARKAGL